MLQRRTAESTVQHASRSSVLNYRLGGAPIGPVLALGSAVTFGLADFAGGLAAKRASAVAVTAISQLTGLLVLLPAIVWLPGTSSGPALLLGGAAGLAGAAGLIVYLRGMAIGPMGVVSPLAAVVGVALPVTYGVWLGERLTGGNLAGVLLGLVAVVCVTYRPGRPVVVGTRGPWLALVGGVGFGAFFVFLDATPADSGLWPLVGARIAAMVLAGALWSRAVTVLPGRRTLSLIVVSGLLDMTANILFLLAVRSGLLSLTSLLASLYPVVVVLLARHLLAERLSGMQVAGVASALVATGLIVA